VGEEDSKSHVDQPVILFDGVCNLCNSSIQFIIRRDSRSRFKFASLQSEAGITLLEKYNISTTQLESVILIASGRVYNRSSAALHIAKNLDGLWPMLYAFIIVPAFIRNLVYDWIAKNRYQWFGKRNECMIPSPELKSRFI
jgi:predicted DCC family thiol-disulfide oxidoreductase YuxK